jgi:hypothetical protein
MAALPPGTAGYRTVDIFAGKSRDHHYLKPHNMIAQVCLLLLRWVAHIRFPPHHERAGELMRQADMFRGFTDSLLVSCSGVGVPNKTHARYRATCMAGSLTALLNHLLTGWPRKRLCTLCCRLHALPDCTNGTRRRLRQDYLLVTSAATKGTLPMSRWHSTM